MADEKDKRTDAKAEPRTGAGGGNPAGKPEEPKKSPPDDDPWGEEWFPRDKRKTRR